MRSLLVGWFGPPKAERPELTFADTRLWTWPPSEEQRARPVEVSIGGFAAWLHEGGHREITRRQLTSLLWEYTELTEARAVGWGRFDKSLKAVGIARFRLGSRTREYRYRVAPAAPKLVAQTRTHRTPAPVELRRAA